MKPITKFSSIVLEEMAQVVAKDKPVITTERGELFILPSRSMIAIRLKNTCMFSDYLNFLQSLDETVRPKSTWMANIARKDFQVITMDDVEVRDGKTFVDEREVVFL